MICIKGQAHATPDDQVAFTGRWGRIEPHPYVPPIEGHPEIIEIYDPNPITVTWHSDFTYAKQPPSVSLLLGRIIPPVGGDTMFSNGYLAYEGLSDGLRDHRRPPARGALRDAARDRQRHARRRDRQRAPGAPARTPRPADGRCSSTTTTRSTSTAGRSRTASRCSTCLYAQFDKPEHTFRHRWEEGDLLIWDNRCAQHSVVGDTDGARRSLHRTTVSGDIPR